MVLRSFQIATLLLISSVCTVRAANAQFCQEHDWFSGQERSKASKSPLCLGIREASFDQRQKALKHLHAAIGSEPHGDHAYQAHEALLSLHFRAAEYGEALVEADAMLSIKPDAKDVTDLRPLLLALSRRKAMSIVRRRSMIPYVQANDPNPHLAANANGSEVLYFMDTGANISVMSDAEAAALGLSVESVSTKMGDVSGESSIAIRVTELPDLAIGKNHLKHVCFVVLPAAQPPFDDLPVNQQAVLGIQVIRALQVVSIHRNGEIEVGGKSHLGAKGSPFVFYQSQPVIQMSFQGKPLDYTMDTGAGHTTLNPLFATTFPQVVEVGESKSHSLTGFGGTTIQKSVEIKELSFTLGAVKVTLSPATVILTNTTNMSTWVAGNLGYDLIRQAQPFTLDFHKMMMFVEPPTTAGAVK